MNQIPNIKKIKAEFQMFVPEDDGSAMDWLESTFTQQLQKARHDWLREEIVKLEGMKGEYPVEAQPTTKDHEMRINWANPVVHQAIQTIIDRYQAELNSK